jgi:hypothetical protein
VREMVSQATGQIEDIQDIDPKNTLPDLEK